MVVVNPTIFREYDIRGAAERDFDAGFAHALGRGYAAYLTERNAIGRGRGGVGRDCPPPPPPSPPPVCSFALFDLDLDGAIQVTGSHNPAEDNGFKVCVGRTTIHG